MSDTQHLRGLSLKERFELQVIKGNGCWAWTGTRDKRPGRGYGQLRRSRERKWVSAHRAAYEIYIGSIPDGLLVLHDCDNPNCVNPKHLHLGTWLDNMQEARTRNRFPPATTTPSPGSKNGNSKLTEEGVMRMIQRLQEQIPTDVIAKEFGVGRTQVRNIRNGVQWAHITRGAIPLPHRRLKQHRQGEHSMGYR